jgi:hypothetical protein
MPNELFNRRASIVIGQYGGTGVRLDDLRISFSITKSMKSSANEASITVYNMAKQSRDLLNAKSVAVQLAAGYGDNVSVIFDGQVIKSSVRRERPMWVTNIDGGDGIVPLSTGRLSRTFVEGESRTSVVNALVNSMGTVALGVNESTALRRSLSAPLTFAGSARRSLDTLARQWGFSWSVQDGAAEFVDKGKKGRNTSAAPLLNQSTGLIGTPEWTEDGLVVQSLLNVRIRPGRPVKLESQTASGIFQVERVVFSGDTHGDDWTSTATMQEAS